MYVHVHCILHWNRCLLIYAFGIVCLFEAILNTHFSFPLPPPPHPHTYTHTAFWTSCSLSLNSFSVDNHAEPSSGAHPLNWSQVCCCLCSNNLSYMYIIIGTYLLSIYMYNCIHLYMMYTITVTINYYNMHKVHMQCVLSPAVLPASISTVSIASQVAASVTDGDQQQTKSKRYLKISSLRSILLVQIFQDNSGNHVYS